MQKTVIIAIVTSKYFLSWFIIICPNIQKIVHLESLHLSPQTKFVWFIWEGPNSKKKPVYLQSLHITLKRKMCFDASQNVPSCRKQYSCNHCIYHIKTKFVLFHQRMSQHAENSFLVVTAYNTWKEKSFWCITESSIR